MTRTGNITVGWRVALAITVSMLACGSASALTLKEAVAVAVESNPEIGQAIENREAIEFELRQAKGLYLPSVDLEASTGVRRLDNDTRRALDQDHEALYPNEADLTVSQTLYDSGARRAELNRQASRVDGASFRVLERSEFIGLAVVQDYLEYMLQASIVAEAKKNLGFHQSILSDIKQGIAGGALNDADRQQAEERLYAAKARMQEATEELEAAKIRFFKNVGKPLTNASRPGDVSAALPRSLDDAIGLARQNNPRVHMANSDIDSAASLVDAARAKYGPTVTAEGVARGGYNIDGADGDTSDLQARVVLRWNLYRGGIDKANEQEQIRRTSEQRDHCAGQIPQRISAERHGEEGAVRVSRPQPAGNLEAHDAQEHYHRDRDAEQIHQCFGNERERHDQDDADHCRAGAR